MLYSRRSNYILMDQGLVSTLIAGLAVSAILISAATRFKKEIKINIILMGVSIVVSTLLVEFGLYASNKIALTPVNWDTAAFRQSEKLRAAKNLGVKWDERSKYKVLADLHKTDANAVLSIHPTDFASKSGFAELNSDQIYPLAGISNRTTILCNESGRWSIYKSDKHGFRNPSKSWELPVEIAIIGDSFAHGACLQEGEDVAARLRNSGRKSISLGILGNGPLVELATLREYGSILKPRTVFWFFYEENDLNNLLSESSSNILMRYISNPKFTQGLAANQSEIDSVLVKYLSIKLANHLAIKLDNKSLPSMVFYLEQIFNKGILSIFKLSRIRQLLGLVFHAPVDPLFRQVLKSAQDTVTSWGGKLVFVNLPGWTRYATATSKLYDSNVLEVARELKIDTLDFDKTLSVQEDPIRFFELRIHNHYNRDGYALLYQLILDHLNNSK
jgi:hypothetical protein